MFSPLVGVPGKKSTKKIPLSREMEPCCAEKCCRLLDFTSNDSDLSANMQFSRGLTLMSTLCKENRGCQGPWSSGSKQQVRWLWVHISQCDYTPRPSQPPTTTLPFSEVTKLLRKLWELGMEVTAANSNKNGETKGGNGGKMSKGKQHQTGGSGSEGTWTLIKERNRNSMEVLKCWVASSGKRQVCFSSDLEGLLWITSEASVRLM